MFLTNVSGYKEEQVFDDGGGLTVDSQLVDSNEEIQTAPMSIQ